MRAWQEAAEAHPANESHEDGEDSGADDSLIVDLDALAGVEGFFDVNLGFDPAAPDPGSDSAAAAQSDFAVFSNGTPPTSTSSTVTKVPETPVLGVATIYTGTNANEDFAGGDEAAEYMYGGGGNDRMAGYSYQDIIYGQDGDDTLWGGDFASVDQLYGGAGNDTLYGGPVWDILMGHAGNDELYGEEGADIMYEGGGDDLFDGGVDNDRMTGGTGADRFAFATGDGSQDSIEDFSRGIDVIDFTAIAGLGFNDLVISAAVLSEPILGIDVGVTIQYGNDSNSEILLLQHTDASAFNASDFDFA